MFQIFSPECMKIGISRQMKTSRTQFGYSGEKRVRLSKSALAERYLRCGRGNGGCKKLEEDLRKRGSGKADRRKEL